LKVYPLWKEKRKQNQKKKDTHLKKLKKKEIKAIRSPFILSRSFKPSLSSGSLDGPPNQLQEKVITKPYPKVIISPPKGRMTNPL